VVLIGLCAVAITGGSNLLRFVTLVSPLGSENYREWVGVPGVTTAALHAALRATAAARGAKPLHEHIELLTELLTVQPLSASAWASRAGQEFAITGSAKEALTALTMSAITGPNEGAVMWQRGIVALLEWEALPPAARQRAIADLSRVIAMGATDDNGLNEVRTVLAAKSPAVHMQIKSMLIDERVTTSTMTRMGL